MNRGPANSPWLVAGPGFVPIMHGMRGFAVLAIVLYHLAGGTQWAPTHHLARDLYESGFLAVDVLFFTTGFVLFLPVVLNGTIGGVRAFAIRRWARLAPAYYVCLVLIGLLFPLLSTQAIARHVDLGATYYLIHFAFLQWELIPGNTGFIVDQPVWTLSIDACFYVLLPLTAVAYLRRPVIGLVLGLVVSAAWRSAFVQLGTPPSAQDKLFWLVQLPLFLGDFAAGMTAAWLFVRLRQGRAADRRPRAFIAATLGALAGLLVLAYIAGSHLPYHMGAYQEPPAVAVLFPLCLLVFVVALALAPARAQWPLVNRATVWFTEISYSVYLYHFPVIFFALFTLGIKINHRFPLVLALAVLPALLTISTISCFVIERPGRRYGRALSLRFAARRSVRPSSSPAPTAVGCTAEPEQVGADP